MISANLITVLASLAAISEAVAIKNQYAVSLEKIGTQEKLFPFLGGAGPHFSFPIDYGIQKKAPENCEISQVQLMARHG